MLDLVGQKFNHLTVLCRMPGSRWECQCDCGNTCLVLGSSLKNNNTKSCGCLKACSGNSSRYWKGAGEIHGAYWYHLVTAARKRKIPVEITMEEAWIQFLKQNRLCALSKEPLLFTTCYSSHPTNTTASLDRIDSSDGYVSGNIQWIHKRLQGMKSNMPQSEFLEWCRAVAKHLP